MSYIVEQKIKGNIYLYEVESYWDKDKKQARQKRTYIGPKNLKQKKVLKSIHSNLVHKNYGNVFLLGHLCEKLGLYQIVKSCFPAHFKELLSLAYYEISTGNPLYLFPFWLEEHHLPGVKAMDSSAISKLCEAVGRDQRKRLDFQRKWIGHIQPVDALYYDITSISSYSNNIDFVEWGYNRDGENLAQINMGAVFCNKKSLPIFYSLYPGSIVDVKTLENCIKYLKNLGLKDFLFVLDRGFFSTGNICKMNEKTLGVRFIQPLPFSLNKAKQLIKLHKKQLSNVNNNFLYGNELLSHFRSEVDLGGNTFTADIFLNEKAEVDQRQLFMKKLIEIEQKTIAQRKFKNQAEALAFKEENIPKPFQAFFKYTRQSNTLERNNQGIKKKVAQFGYFVLSNNSPSLNREDILAMYRNKDQVEKVFDLLKNEMDGGRLRAHGQYNAEARIFIKFIGLILQSELMKTMREKQLFKKYSIKEMLAELSKVKFTYINGEVIISELSKKNRLILEAFGIDKSKIHSY
jgi:transposase